MRLDLRVDDAQVALGPFEGACRVPGGENLRHEEGAEPPRPLGGEERSGPGLADVCHQVAGEDGEPPVVEGLGRVALQDPRHPGFYPRPGADLLDHRVQQVRLPQGLEGAVRLGGGGGRSGGGEQVPHQAVGVAALGPQREQAPQVTACRVAPGARRRGAAVHRGALALADGGREEEPEVVVGLPGPGGGTEPGSAGVRQERADRVEHPDPLRDVRERPAGARGEGDL